MHTWLPAAFRQFLFSLVYPTYSHCGLSTAPSYQVGWTCITLFLNYFKLFNPCCKYLMIIKKAKKGVGYIGLVGCQWDAC